MGSDWSADESVYIHYLVSDSGTGISDEDQKAVFSRFSQGSAKDYSQYGGSGLGLYICRALVEIHGGQIGFRSELGKGSSFGFCIKTRRLDFESCFGSSTGLRLNRANPSFTKTIPSSSPSITPFNTKMTPPTISSPEASGKSREILHILIVEDNLINQKVLSKQLLKVGHLVTIANHGKEGLSVLSNSHFCAAPSQGEPLSIILMDIEMPVMNGIECTKEIRRMEKDGEIRGHVPIVATTGNARGEKIDLIREAGVDEVILKPYSVVDLLALVQSLVVDSGGASKVKNMDE